MLTTFALLAGLLAPGGNATLKISVSPSNASITVDGKPQKVGLGGVSVAPGSHQVAASAPGHRAETRTVNAPAGKTVSVKFSLTPVANTKSPIGTAKPAVAKAPGIRKPVRTPAAKTPAAKTPATKEPAAKRPVAKRPVAKRPVAKRPVSKTPVAKKPEEARPVVKKPVGVTRKPTTGTDTQPKTVARPRNNRPVSGGGTVGGATPVAGERRPMSTKPFAVLSWIVGGVAITGGVLAGMEAQDYADQFNDSVRRREKQGFKQDAENWALGSNVLYGVGATAVVVGALLWAMDPADRYGAQVAPLPGGGAYVGFGGSF